MTLDEYLKNGYDRRDTQMHDNVSHAWNTAVSEIVSALREFATGAGLGADSEGGCHCGEVAVDMAADMIERVYR